MKNSPGNIITQKAVRYSGLKEKVLNKTLSMFQHAFFRGECKRKSEEAFVELLVLKVEQWNPELLKCDICHSLKWG